MSPCTKTKSELLVALICITKTEAIHFNWKHCLHFGFRREEVLDPHRKYTLGHLSNWPGHAWPEDHRWDSFGKPVINEKRAQVAYGVMYWQFSCNAVSNVFCILIYLVVEVCTRV